MPSDAEYPRFIDVLCAAVFTLWLVASLGLSLYAVFLDNAPISTLITVPIGFLFGGLLPALVLGGLISYPFWWLGKRLNRLDVTLATFVGGLTGFIITVIPFFFVPIDDLTASITEIKAYLIATFLFTSLGAISGWNGYRVAWNGRRRKKRLTT